jgi:hypothetical protein
MKKKHVARIILFLFCLTVIAGMVFLFGPRDFVTMAVTTVIAGGVGSLVVWAVINAFNGNGNHKA